jgi:hypothetical protein
MTTGLRIGAAGGIRAALVVIAQTDADAVEQAIIEIMMQIALMLSPL